MGIKTKSRTTAPRKKKPDELLSSVVRETTVTAAVDLLKENEAFTYPRGDRWAILVLQVDSIGGLSKRDSKDATKGSIVELIDHDAIHTVATQEMLAENILGIIPTPSTLERMEEYSLLTEASYGWATLWLDPTNSLIVDPSGEASFDAALQVSNGQAELSEVLPEGVWEQHATSSSQGEAVGSGAHANSPAIDHYWSPGQDVDPWAERFPEPETSPAIGGDSEKAEEQEDAPPADEADQNPAFEGDTDLEVEETGPVGKQTLFDEPGPDELDDLLPPVSDQGQQDETPTFESEFDESETPFGDDIEGAGDEGVDDPVKDATTVRSQLARRFQPEDLDLQISLDEFETILDVGRPVIGLDVPEGASEWLGDQVAQMARSANADLARLRERHENALRTEYVNLMSQHADSVMKQVSIQREGTAFAAAAAEADRAHQERLAGKDEAIRKAKTEIATRYTEQADEAAEYAAAQARTQWVARNSPRMEREQIDAASRIERDIENEHSWAMGEILNARRQRADLLMERGDSEVFKLLAEKQREFDKAEQELVDAWQADIAALVEDHRAADIARVKALDEQQRTTDEVARVTEEARAEMDRVTAEHTLRVGRLEDALAQERKDAATEQTVNDEKWAHKVALANEQAESQIARNSELRAELDGLAEKYRADKDKEVSRVMADRDAYIQDVKRSTEMQKRFNGMFLVLIVAIGVLMLVAGVIAGVTFF